MILYRKIMVLSIISFFIGASISTSIAHHVSTIDENDILVKPVFQPYSDPIVTINYPNNQSIFETNDITVSGTASDFDDGLYGIKWIHITNHGSNERYYEFEEIQHGTYYFFWPFTMDEGWNTFTVIAYNTNQEEGSDSVTVYYYPEGIHEDLYCSGSLSWSNVEPDTLVQSSFTVSNLGHPLSELDWEVQSYPEWGEWTFLPNSENNLKPSDGETIVEVYVKVPDEENKHFNDTVTIVNKNDISDAETIQVTLSTPKQKEFNYFDRILDRIDFLFKLNLKE